MIKHLYGTPNPLYIKWSLQHRPPTVRLVLRLFQKSCTPHQPPLCPDLHSAQGNCNPLDAANTFFSISFFKWRGMHFQTIRVGSASALKNVILNALKQKTSPPGFRVFMSRLVSADDNCFSCCGETEAAFAITCMLKTLNHSTVMSYTLPANITKEAKPFYQHPDMLKSLIRGGFYKLLNWLTISSRPRKLLPETWFYVQELAAEKRVWGYHFATGWTCTLP